MALHGKNKHHRLKDIQRRHFNETAVRCGLGTAEFLIQEVLKATPGVISAVQRRLPTDFPQHVLDAILQGLWDSAKRLEAMSPD